MSVCELCGKLPDWRGLVDHHKDFHQSQGGRKHSPTIRICGKCHSKEHGIIEVDSKPQWRTLKT